MKRLATVVAVLTLIGTPAFAADMAVGVPLPSPVPSPAYGWTGFYVGGNLGYAWTNTQVPSLNTNDGPLGLAALILTGVVIPGLKSSSIDGGFDVGYNWQINQNWLAGIEADLDFGHLRAGAAVVTTNVLPPPGAASTLSEQLKWFGTVRARAGFLPTSNLLLFATGGLAYARVTANGTVRDDFGMPIIGGNPGSTAGCNFTNAPTTCFAGQYDQIRYGWTVGAGLEYALWGAWTIKAEYLYVGLPSTHFTEGLVGGPVIFGSTTPVITAQFNNLAVQVVRGGLNYRF